MDIRNRSPFIDDDDPDRRKLLDELIQKHGVVLDPQDPILLVEAMIRNVVQSATERVEAAVKRVTVRMEASANLAIDKQSQLFNAQKEALRLEAKRIVDELRRDIRAAVDGERLANEVRATVCRQIELDIDRLLRKHVAEIEYRVNTSFNHFDRARHRANLTWAAAGGALLMLVLVLGFKLISRDDPSHSPLPQQQALVVPPSQQKAPTDSPKAARRPRHEAERPSPKTQPPPPAADENTDVDEYGDADPLLDEYGGLMKALNEQERREQRSTEDTLQRIQDRFE